MNEMIEQKLRAPFPSKDVEWRIQSVDKDKLRGLAVPYIDSRAVQNRLDEVFGIYGWQNTFSPWHTRKKGASGQIESQICGISVYDKNTRRMDNKMGRCGRYNIEPIKGGLSDSFKRAAVQWELVDTSMICRVFLFRQYHIETVSASRTTKRNGLWKHMRSL